MVNRYGAQVWMLREALRQAKGYDAASERLRQFVADIRMVPKNGTLGTMVKTNAGKLLDAGGLIPSSKCWLRGGDLNPRPLGYEPNELPDCSTPRHGVRRNSPNVGCSGTLANLSDVQVNPERCVSVTRTYLL